MPNWSEVLDEISGCMTRADLKLHHATNLVRKKYINQLHEITGRNIIAYYSGWLSKGNNVFMTLTDEDKNGFMTCVHKLDRGKGLDLVLHTPGGSISATQSLVYYLRDMFDDDIRAIVPQIAMSAGTMLACSCKSIIMGKQSNLGPIDPQLGGIPAYTAIEEFDRAAKDVIDENGEINRARLSLWEQIIRHYRPTFLTQCEHAIKRSNQFVEENLEAVMFRDLKDGRKKAKKVVQALTRHQDGHDRHYHLADCQKMGLVITALEDDQSLQDAVLSIHHSYMHTLMNTPAMKIVENHLGVGMFKNMAV